MLFRSEHVDIGYNYRLSNLLAGLGRAQLARLPSMIERRRDWRVAYRQLFAEIDGATVFGGDDGSAGTVDHDNFWLTSILVDEAEAGWAAADLQQHLTTLNIEARPLWKPMHLQPVFAGATSYVDGTSDALFATGISLPSGSSLSDEQFAKVTSSILAFARDRKR